MTISDLPPRQALFGGWRCRRKEVPHCRFEPKANLPGGPSVLPLVNIGLQVAFRIRNHQDNLLLPKLQHYESQTYLPMYLS